MPPFLSEKKGANNSDSWKTMWYIMVGNGKRHRLVRVVCSNCELGTLELWLTGTVGHFARRRANRSASEGALPDLAAPNSSWSCSTH